MMTKHDGHEADAGEAASGRAAPAVAAAAARFRSLGRRDDQEFDVVWSGVGPLPGTGEREGLGSTLSGVRFSIGKRR
jgi:hypothetical protein